MKIWKIINIIRTLDAAIIPLGFLIALVDSISGYITIVMLPQIMRQLILRTSAYYVMRLILITVAANVTFLALSKLMSALYEKRKLRLQHNYKKLKTKKYMSVDYKVLEDSNFEQLRQVILNSDDMMGAFEQFIDSINNIFRNVISSVIALLIFGSIFNLIYSANYEGVLLYPVFLISLTVISTILVALLQKRATKVVPHIMGQMTWVNIFAMYLISEVVLNYKFGMDIRIYKLNDLLNEELNKATDNFIPFYKKLFRVSNLPGMVGVVQNAIINGATLVMTGVFAINGVIGFEDVVLYSGAIIQLISSISALFLALGSCTISSSMLLYSLELLELPEVEPNIDTTADQIVPQTYTPLFAFRDVSFMYPGSSEYALAGVNFEINQGDILAIVGENGSGKSTIIKLLCRFYEPTSGEILYNGVNISNIDILKYRKALAVVFQDFELFSDSVGSNVAIARTYDRSKVLDSLNRVNFSRDKSHKHDIDSTIYKYYDNSGIEISGGEAQKISIARAIYKKSSIFIFDEPSSALDPKAEVALYEQLANIVGTKTAIYIHGKSIYFFAAQLHPQKRIKIPVFEKNAA
ncbi:MAG: ATP-binding cassette domain-containing protein [Christensenellaceae bacterium]|nr:ATP-binding cassette domain-containing protein [Christensenellaceae bacterium]